MVLALFCQNALPAVLSVLALSSRFDGLVSCGLQVCSLYVFQYSLCRVVLMVPARFTDARADV